jgi:bacterioferritin (cytochrome b1)
MRGGVSRIMYLQQVGKINRKRFDTTKETVLDILEQRLKSEKDVSVRQYIRQKIKLFR